MAPVQKKTSYHHGDLRSALLQATVELVDEQGVAGFTLREIARRAGVSHAAPYHHFEDKAQILAAVADDGFDMLEKALREVIDEQDHPLLLLRSLCERYIRFAVEQQPSFRVMFRAGSPAAGDDPALADRCAAIIGLFAQGASLLPPCRKAGPAETRRVALTAWCTAHGLATLWVDGPLSASVLARAGLDSLAEAVFSAAIEEPA